MTTSLSVNNMRSTGTFINNGLLNNDVYVKEEDTFESENKNDNYNSNSDLTNEKINNKRVILMNKGNIEEETDRRIELKNMDFQYCMEKFQNLKQNCKINEYCLDLEKNVIIKEEIIISDTLESDEQSIIGENERFNSKTMIWSNVKSILKPKINKYSNEQNQISITNVKNNQLIIQRKSKNNFCMVIGIVDTNMPPLTEIPESVISDNKRVTDSFNDNESSFELVENTEDLESESVSETAEPISATENEYLNNAVEALKTIAISKRNPKSNLCINGFLRILKNISKLKQGKMPKETVNNLLQTHESIPNNNHLKKNSNDSNNNSSLNIKIANVVSQAKSLPKDTEIDSPNVEKIKVTNLVPQAKSILKSKIHILDTKSNKIIVTPSDSSGKTKLFREKKVETPMKVIEQMKSKCLLFCSVCSIHQKIDWSDKLKKCTKCSKEMKYMCYECKEIFSSSVQFYVHDRCSCKFKLESGYYWKCNSCNYLVHKMTNCHQNFCEKHPSLKCKYCSSVTVHLSEFTKYSIKKKSIKIPEEDNLGIELECTPLSSMPGQKLNIEKDFVLVCPAGCKCPARKRSTGRVLCSVCGLLMQYKCMGCEALLKSYSAAYKHCSWCCSPMRTYYCASCDVFSQQRFDRASITLAPITSGVRRCGKCLVGFVSRGKLNAHRRRCGKSLWLLCGLCSLKQRTPGTLRAHLDEVHREHANVALRARVFKFAIRAWRRSTDLNKWKAKKISESEKNRLKDQKIPMVLLEKLPDHVVQNIIDGQKFWTYDAITGVEDVHDSIIFDEVGDQSTVNRQSFFNSQQTAYLNNVNSLLDIPDSDEEVTAACNNLLFERKKNLKIPFKTEEQISHNEISSSTEKSSKQNAGRPASHARRRRIRKRRSEPLRCEHCGYLTNSKKELVEHIMGRHAARLFRGVGFDCPRCSCVFSNYHIYERHLQSRHRLQR